ncbi:ABC transporter substrate-binding protein [Acidimicrobiaceae bacterium AH-315-P05]|nr:ABC transporter substrate-binding protein [Acidimicrobiaceae bacterium AH-315-P05]
MINHRSRMLAVLAVIALFAAACTGGDSEGADDNGSGASQTTGDSTTGSTGTTATTQDIATATTIAAPDETGAVLVRGGEISIGLTSETNTGFFPPSAETSFSAGFLVMDALYDRWFVQTGTGELLPEIAAARATPNADASEWTMTIREGIQFHDGTDVNAEAAVGMVELWLEGPFGATSSIESAEVVDEFTVKYILKDPNPAFEGVLAGISTGAVFSPTAGRSFGAEASVENPVGTGPFVFEEWTRDSELIVRRNDNYWRTAPDGGTLPYLDRIRFRVLPDGDSRRASLQAGDIEMATQGGVTGGQDLVDAGFVPYEYIGNGAGVIIFNTAVPPFDDVRMRRAASHALDPNQSNAISPSTLAGVFDLRNGYFNSTSPWFSEEAGADYAFFDTDEAIRLSTEYINDPTRSDGKAVGEAISFSFDCTSEPTNIQTAQLFQQEWGDLGFEVEIKSQEQSSFITQIIGGPTEEVPFTGEFQAACWADGSSSDPLEIFRTRYGDGQVLNWTNFTDPTIDAAIETLRNDLTVDGRHAATEDITRVTAEQMPIRWGSSTATLLLAIPEIKGVEAYTHADGTVGARRSAGRVWWAEVWLEEAQPVDIASGPVELPATTAAPELGGPNEAVAAAMPDAPPGILTKARGTEALETLCPAITTFEDIEFISATYQNYNGVPTFGPFVGVRIYELAEGDADIVLARYEQAVAECATYTDALDDGTPLNLGWVTRNFGSFGDTSASYGVAGDAGGFPIDSDILVIKTGNNLAIISDLNVGSASGGTNVTALAPAVAEILEGLAG